MSSAPKTACCVVAIAAACSTLDANALDKNGNFESRQEQEAFIAVTLKKMAAELNSQAPVQLDEETRMMSVIALQKTITFNMRLSSHKGSQIDAKRVTQAASENLNRVACGSKATRDLIDLGVQYIYLYSGSDGKFVARVVIDRYRC